MTKDNPYDLSPVGQSALKWCIEQDTSGCGLQIPVNMLVSHFALDRVQTEDLVGELDRKGLVTINNSFSGSSIEVTPSGPLGLKGIIQFELDADVREVASVLCSGKTSMGGAELHEKTQMDARRLNFAARYIEEQGLAVVAHELGQNDYCFSSMTATYETRQFIKRNE